VRTEQTFLSRILYSHLQQFGMPVVLKTKVTRAGQQHKCGVSTYARIRHDPVRDKPRRSRIVRTAEPSYNVSAASGLPPEVGETSSGCALTRRLCTKPSMRSAVGISGLEDVKC